MSVKTSKLYAYSLGISAVAVMLWLVGCPLKPQAKTLRLQGTSVSSLKDSANEPLLSRKQMIASLQQDHFDIVIIGGGATGAGALLDAASRGLNAALIEAEDYSLGTSSRSTKLVHGGVRYLENAVKHMDRQEYALVRDALQERMRFLQNAPHLTNALGILTPVYGWWDAFYYWVGLKCYDFIAGKASLGRSQFLSRNEAMSRFPMLKKEGLKGAVLYYDGQFDDARMNLSLVLSAIQKGAKASNYVRVLSLLKEGQEIRGVMVKDEISGQIWPLRARVVINATGPFADVIRKMDDPSLASIMVPSQGSHVLLPKSFSPQDCGLIIPKTKDGRVIFLLPWQGQTLAGTTDHLEPLTEYPRATEDEVAYILEHISHYFDLPLKRSDVKATFSGLRPLAKPEENGSNTAQISRDHLIEVSKNKLITIVGGKWTTYRKMAEEVIDCAVKVFALEPKGESQTKDLKLIGASSYEPSLAERLALVPGLSTESACHLAHAYGDQATNVLDTDKALYSLLVEGFPYIEAEVIYCIRHEYALRASDILARRLRLAFLSYEASLKALPRVLDLMARELSWDEPKKESERVLAMDFLKTMQTAPVP